MAHPEAIVEQGSATFRVKAKVAEGEERQRLFDAQTTRLIPVIILERID